MSAHLWRRGKVPLDRCAGFSVPLEQLSGAAQTIQVTSTKNQAGHFQKEGRMRFKCIEFSWRAAFIGLYLTPERDKLWVTIVPFFPLYFKKNA